MGKRDTHVWLEERYCKYCQRTILFFPRFISTVETFSRTCSKTSVKQDRVNCLDKLYRPWYRILLIICQSQFLFNFVCYICRFLFISCIEIVRSTRIMYHYFNSMPSYMKFLITLATIALVTLSWRNHLFSWRLCPAALNFFPRQSCWTIDHYLIIGGLVDNGAILFKNYNYDVLVHWNNLVREVYRLRYKLYVITDYIFYTSFTYNVT